MRHSYNEGLSSVLKFKPCFDWVSAFIVLISHSFCIIKVMIINLLSLISSSIIPSLIHLFIYCEVNDFFCFVYLILPAALGPGVYSVSNSKEYQKQEKMFLGSRERPVPKTDNLTRHL
jgi:hypothetical protein